MVHEIVTKKGPDDVAARVDATGRGVGLTREVNCAQRALLAQQETVRDKVAVKIPSNDIALVVDSVCLRDRGTRIIDGAEHSVFVEEEAVSRNLVLPVAYDISGSIDPGRQGIDCAWDIYRGEAASAAEEANGSQRRHYHIRRQCRHGR